MSTIEAWKTIQDHFSPKNNEYMRESIRKRYYEDEWKDDESFQAFLSRLQNYRKQLIDSTSAINDVMLRTRILDALPSSLHSVKLALYGSERQTLLHTIQVINNI